MLRDLLIQKVNIPAAVRDDHVARLPVLPEILLGIVEGGRKICVHAARPQAVHQHPAVDVARVSKDPVTPLEIPEYLLRQCLSRDVRRGDFHLINDKSSLLKNVEIHRNKKQTKESMRNLYFEQI